ncbi:hypothetical protein Aduo_009166 [Ancylostoma duodenale]
MRRNRLKNEERRNRATLNWGVLIAWAEMLPQEQFFTVLPLYFSTVLHTVIYDTIYSHQVLMHFLIYHLSLLSSLRGILVLLVVLCTL